ncbi:MAG: hypothetical protein IRY84_16575, partial [Thermobispora bispora]|nr:hypothetical protein [Thermobispora bispora]
AFVSALHHTVTVSVALLAGTALMVALLLPRSAQEPAGEGAPEGQE